MTAAEKSEPEGSRSERMLEVLLDGIDNHTIANGAPFMIVIDETGRYGLAQRRGEAAVPCSRFIKLEDAAEWALKALSGDKQAITHPRIIVTLALALIGAIAEGNLRKERT